MSEEQRDREKRETPIIDGDARPDINLDPENDAQNRKRNAQKTDDKFKTERSSDINSLEDYKDAK